MTVTTNDVERLIKAANDLAAKAKSDPALAEQLLNNPKGLIAQAAGRAIPTGVQLVARRSNGAIQIEASLDPAADGELDDKLLESVAGGVLKERGGQASGSGLTYLAWGAQEQTGQRQSSGGTSVKEFFSKW